MAYPTKESLGSNTLNSTTKETAENTNIPED
jgi:hypothetical protein